MEAGAGLSRRVGHSGAAQLAAVLAVAVLLGIGAGAAGHFLLVGSSPSARASGVVDGLRGEATWAAGARPAPAITTLRDQTGARFSLGSLHGHTGATELFGSPS